jgi:hypothetical protein
MKNIIIFYILLESFLVNNIKMAGMEAQKKAGLLGAKQLRINTEHSKYLQQNCPQQ